MSKELPYFKFQPSEWMTGDITLCSMEAQGLFINLCSYYWIRDCNISLANAQQRFSNCFSLFEELQSKDILKVNGDEKIIINFLDEQMEKFTDISAKRSKSGGIRKEQMQSKCKTNAPHKDKEENKKKRKIYSEQAHNLFLDLVILFDEKLRPDTETKKDKWLDVCEKLLKTNDYDHIKNIVKRARMDDFWSGNFLSLNKLLQTNKDGVKYFIVFENRFNGIQQKPKFVQ